MPAEVQQALSKLAEAQSKALKQSTWVGSEFAETSRKMHYGEAEKRSIYGEATREEAEDLAEEGIEVSQMPWLTSRNS